MGKSDVVVLKKKKKLPEVKDDSEEVLQVLHERLKRIRLKVPPRPLGPDGKPANPVLPRDITLLTDEKLGRLHGEFAAMVSYTYGQLAVQSVKHGISKRYERIVRAKVRLTKSGTVDDKAAKVEVDPRVQKSSLDMLAAESMEVLTESIHQGFQVGKDVCSREITRRMGLNTRM